MQQGGSDDSDMDEPMDDMTPDELKMIDPKRHARAQHNALERRRRDNIKDMYTYLRDTLPDIQNERASRAMILSRAIDVIKEKQSMCQQTQAEIAAIEEENRELERQCALLIEKRKTEMGETSSSSLSSDQSSSSIPVTQSTV